MAFHPGGTVVTRQPRTENNNDLFSRQEILSIDQFSPNKKERVGNEYTEDPWLRRQHPPPIPPRTRRAATTRVQTYPKCPMNRRVSCPPHPQPATIPSGRLTLITTTENGGNFPRNGCGTVTHLVKSPPPFNKPPPKLPYSDHKVPDFNKPPATAPRPDVDVVTDDIEKCKRDQKKQQQQQCHVGEPQSQRICRHCGRCKCAGCRNSGKLPETTLCNDRCLLSADSVLEKCTCLCAVKFAFFHCSECCSCLADDYDDNYMCADKPCLCSAPGQNHCCIRWTAMGAMSLVLPCLWCYWPGKGCVKLCRACYNSTHSRGCQCPARTQELDHLL